MRYTFQKKGYKDGSSVQNGKFNSVVVANLLLGGLVGGLIDYATGAWYKYDGSVYYKFKDGGDITIPEGGETEVVTRNKAGGTSLEKTIIRWYFDSDPRGARVFWRVISGNPSQVKNTNELYLGSTPFEQTKSFDILGLTYANSRTVQIEIKITRKGYIDQVKRFNVRQAIDQQEVSSFYELVKR